MDELDKYACSNVCKLSHGRSPKYIFVPVYHKLLHTYSLLPMLESKDLIQTHSIVRKGWNMSFNNTDLHDQVEKGQTLI